MSPLISPPPRFVMFDAQFADIFFSVASTTIGRLVLERGVGVSHEQYLFVMKLALSLFGRLLISGTPGLTKGSPVFLCWRLGVLYSTSIFTQTVVVSAVIV